MEVMQNGWAIPTSQTDKAKKVVNKLKNLIRVLREWSKQLSNLAATISNTKEIIMLLDILE